MAPERLFLARAGEAILARVPFGVARVIDVAAAALEREKGLRQAKARARIAIEFLPAALEVLESPPSPVGRALAWSLMALFVLGLGWSFVGEVDVVAVAEGKTIPSGYTKIVQPMEAGVVKAIRVRDGDHVTAGQILVELDPTQNAADSRNLSEQLASARSEAARHMAEAAPDPLAAFAPPSGGSEAAVEASRRLLRQEVDTQKAKLDGLDSEIRRGEADLAAGRATVDKLERTVPLLKKRVDAKGILAERGYSSRISQLELEQQLIEMQQELVTQRHRVEQSEASLASSRHARTQAAADFVRNALTQQDDAEKKIASLTQDLAKAAQRTGLQTLTAPVSGTVQELALHTEGGVVQQAQKLLSIVPDDSGLEIEAKLLNRDIGFVTEGQEAAIKLEAFEYTKYGTVPGTVVWVSRDAVVDDKLGLLYPVRVLLARTEIDVGPRSVKLGPGLSATVEIKTEKRRVIEYLLSSLQRYRHESMRER